MYGIDASQSEESNAVHDCTSTLILRETLFWSDFNLPNLQYNTHSRQDQTQKVFQYTPNIRKDTTDNSS